MPKVLFKELATALRAPQLSESERSQIETKIYNLIFPSLLRHFEKFKQNELRELDPEDLFDIATESVRRVIRSFGPQGTYQPNHTNSAMSYVTKTAIRLWNERVRAIAMAPPLIPVNPFILDRHIPLQENQDIHFQLMSRLKLIWPLIPKEMRHLLWEKSRGIKNNDMAKNEKDREGTHKQITHQAISSKLNTACKTLKDLLLWILQLEKTYRDNPFVKRPISTQIARQLADPSQRPQIMRFVEQTYVNDDFPSEKLADIIQGMSNKNVFNSISFFLDIPEKNNNDALERIPAR